MLEGFVRLFSASSSHLAQSQPTEESERARQREGLRQRFDKAKDKQESFDKFCISLSHFFRRVDVKENHISMFMIELKTQTKPVAGDVFSDDMMNAIIARHKKQGINLKLAVENLIENKKIKLKDKLKMLRNLAFPQSLLQPSSPTSEELLGKYNSLMEKIQWDQRFWQASENSLLRFNIGFFRSKKWKDTQELKTRVSRLESIVEDFNGFSQNIICIQQPVKKSASGHKRKRVDFEGEDNYGYDDVGSSSGSQRRRFD